MTDPKPWMRTAAEKIAAYVGVCVYTVATIKPDHIAALIAESAPTAPSGEGRYRRNWIIHFDNLLGWRFEHAYVDGASDSNDGRFGSGKSREDCEHQIDEYEAQNASVFAWLVEGPDQTYLHFWETLRRFNWTKDPHQAMRFSRFIDAGNAMCIAKTFQPELFDGGIWERTKPIEHGWSSLSRPTAETQPAPAGDLGGAFEKWAADGLVAAGPRWKSLVEPFDRQANGNMESPHYRHSLTQGAWLAYKAGAAQSGRPAMTEGLKRLLDHLDNVHPKDSGYAFLGHEAATTIRQLLGAPQ